MSKENVKFAKPEDVAVLSAFTYTTYEEIGFTRSPVDLPTTIEKLTEAIMNDVVLVYRNDDDVIQGVLGMQISNFWWSKEPILTSFLFHVKEEARGSSVANDLLEAGKEYGIMGNMDIIFDIFGIGFHRKGKLLKRKGFEEAGTVFYFDHLADKEDTE